MKKTYFITTDCHSYYSLMMAELLKKDFDIDNPLHILITCGDMFDRGDESKQMLNFLYLLFQNNRLIYIRGNHDDLFQDLVARKNYFERDISNKTIKTLGELQLPESYKEYEVLFNFPMVCNDYDKRIDELYQISLNYYEKGNYIFTHGWIPFKEDDYGKYLYDPEWRSKSDRGWDQFRWENGMSAWKSGIIEAEKTIVCGHWHCSYGWSHLLQKRKEFPDKSKTNWEKSFEPFIQKGIIALDACTAYSGIVNILKLTEDDFYEEEN